MSTELASAYVTLIPSLRGAQKTIQAELSGIDVSSAGTQMGKNLSGSFDRSFSTRALESVAQKAQSVGSALTKYITAPALAAGAAIAAISLTNLSNGIARTDTINNFPKVMANLGISSELAQKTINGVASSLEGLPTGLDEAASGIQRLVSKNGDLSKSSDYFLALNNAILAGGGSTQIQSAALEQLTQSYAKGRMDMMEWRTLQMAMPAQLNQIAKAMNTTSDALGEGLRDGSISMEDFMQTMTKLNKTGVDGFSSLEEQARAATGGIATSMKNVSNAFARGWQKILNSIGSENISKAFVGISEAIGSVATKVSASIAEFMPKIQPFIDALGMLKDVRLHLEAKDYDTWIKTLPESAQNAANLAQKIREMAPIITKVGAVAAAIGPALLVGSKVIGIVSEMSTNYGKLATKIDDTDGKVGKLNKSHAGLKLGAAAAATGLLALGMYMANSGKSADEMAADITAGAQNMAAGISAFAANLPAVINAVVPVLVDTIKNIAGMLPTILPPLIAALVQGLTAIATALPQIIPPLVQGLVSVIVALAQTLPTLIPMLLNAAVQLFMALVEALPTVITALVTAIPQVITAVVNMLPTLIPALLTAAVQLFMAIVKAIPQISMAVVKAIPEIVNAVIGILPSLIPALFDASVQLFMGLLQALQQIGAMISPALGDAMQSAINKLGEFFGQFSEIGKNIIDGIVKGITDFGKSIGDSLWGIVGGAVDWIKNLLGIHSPSRVMAEIGKNMMLGLSGGITSQAKQAVAAMKSSVNSMVSVASAGLGGFGASPISVSSVRQPAQTSAPVASSRNDLSEFATMVVDGIKESLNGMGINMNGEPVGKIVYPYVDGLIAVNQSARERGL